MILTRQRVWVVAAVATLATGATAAAMDVPLSQPLQQSRTLSLPFVPGHVLFRPDTNEFVVSPENNGKDQTAIIAVYDLQSLVEIYRQQIPHIVDALAFSEKGDWLYAIGGNNGDGFASAIDLRSAPAEMSVLTVKLAKLPVLPSLAVDASRRLYIGDATSNRITVIPPYVFEIEDDPTKVSQLFYSDSGVRSVAVSSSLGLAFVAANDLAKVSAMELSGSNRISDEYSPVGSKEDLASGTRPPLAMTMTDAESPDGEATVSFLIADHQTGALSLVDYDPLFQTLDLVTTTTVGHHLTPGSAIEFEPGTKLVKQPMLIASDGSQSTILSGNLYANELVQFSRADFAGALERVGEIKLAGSPTAMAVSADGDAAVVALAGSRDLEILATVQGADEVTESAKKAKVRQLQRALTGLGFNVGAIDGVQGSATQRALGVFQKNSSMDFPLSDVDAALDAVTQFSNSCSKSGLRCFLKEGK